MKNLRMLAGALALALMIGCATGQSAVEPEGQRYGALPSRTLDSDLSSLEDATSTLVADNGFRLLCFEFVILSTGDPVGNLEVEASIDGTNFFDVFLDANKVYGNGSFAGGTTVAINDPAATLAVGVCLENPFPYTRLFYDRTSGGAAAAIDIYTHWLTK